MAVSATSFLIASVVTFVFVLAITQTERRRGRRLFAGRIRGWLDTVVSGCERWFAKVWNHFVRYVLQLNWYYSIHSVLRTMLRFTQGVYTHFERMFERNRDRARELRREKRELSTMNHLRDLAEHKEDTALTPAQKQRLKHKKLEEKH